MTSTKNSQRYFSRAFRMKLLRENTKTYPVTIVPFSHGLVLGILHVLYSTANGLGFGAMIAMYAFLLLSPLRNPAENAGNLMGLMIFLAVFPFAVIFPMLGGLGLLNRKQWAARLIGFCSPFTFVLVLGITYIWVWELEEPVALVYGLPSLLMSLYGGWYAWRSARATKALQMIAREQVSQVTSFPSA